VRKAYDEGRANDQGRPIRGIDQHVEPLDARWLPIDDTDWLDERERKHGRDDQQL
jgi:hypothetical protein